MQKTKFGAIDFEVSRIGFGGASVSGEGRGYGLGSISEDLAVGLVREAFDMGINLFDTAPIYGHGLSEIRIGKALKAVREKAFVVSKSGVGWHTPSMRVDMDNNPIKTRKMLEDSLRRLNLEYIDLYMVHWPDSKWDIRYPLEVIFEAAQKGLVKYIGLCNTNENDLNAAASVCQLSAVQAEYNLFNQTPLESIKTQIKESNLATMAWGTLDKGILSGRVDENRKFEQEDARSWAPWWKKSEVKQKVMKVHKLQKELPDYSLLSLALQFNLSNPWLHCNLVGARSSEQLQGLFNALKNPISEQDLLKAKEILS